MRRYRLFNRNQAKENRQTKRIQKIADLRIRNRQKGSCLMGFDKREYLEYEEKLYSITDSADYTEEITNQLFTKLLSVLPNNGKLYKYKALDTFHIDELEEKYIWFSSAANLNDNKDCTFNANCLKEMDSMVKFFLTDNNYRKVLVQGLYLDFSKNNPDITPEIIEDCLACVNNKGKAVGKLRVEKFCKDYKLTHEQKQELIKNISLYSDKAQNEKAIWQSISDLHEQMQEIRKGIRVCSLTTSFKKDSMWAYYCNNRGICVEYDFSKISSYDTKRVFINTQKVRYGRKKKFSYIDIIKAKIDDSPGSIANADKMIISQLLTKDKSWLTEDEWRVVMFIKDNKQEMKVPADIISAIYIDYSILQEETTKHIIDLAKTNGWGVFVRYFDSINVEYRYETVENTYKYIDELKKIGLFIQ